MLTIYSVLVLGCSGEKLFSEPSPLSVTPEVSTSFPTLPPPSQIKFDSELTSDRLKPGLDFEVGLPNALISDYGGRAKFDSNWEEDGEPAYAMYRLLPETDWNNTIHTMWGYRNYGPNWEKTWIGIADYSLDSWRWVPINFTSGRTGSGGYLGTSTFSEGDYERDGHLLIAAVTIDTNYLYWLLVGGEQPPYVKSVSPDLVMTGAVTTFTAELHAEVATSWSWDFGEGVLPRLSTQEQPLVAGQELGGYTGVVTVNNNSGSFAYAFNYQVTEASEFLPQHLYAIPEETTVQVGEELLVTITTGTLPEFQPLTFCSFGLLVSSDVEYVGNSSNIGSPGGDKTDIDGLWAEMEPLPTAFLTQPDSLIKPTETGIPGMVRFDMICAPFGSPQTSKSGDLFNLKLVFRQPGEYHLSFQPFYGIHRTFYSDSNGDDFNWYDISNLSVPAITVLP